jgi:L-amino acid N-acyltransferase YncA
MLHKHSLDCRMKLVEAQACIASVYTLPAYRNRGLNNYGYFKRQEYLKQSGIKSATNIINQKNIPTQKVHRKYGIKEIATGRYVRFFFWQHWKEGLNPE